jgi:RHS repeat-associated protein
VLGIINNKNTARSQTFTYDGLNRLLTAQTASTWGVNFTNGIDPWGNLYQTGTISGTTGNPMSVNQAVNVKNQFTLLGYGYDAAGNVLQDGSGNTSCSGNAYTWNSEEQLTCALGASYTYDGDGARVEKTGGGATATLYWGAVAESNTSGTLTSEYIFLNGRRIARRDIATGSVYYYFADMLGSSNVVATSTGALENESDFYPFGGELPVTQNLTNQKYKFEGKERDPESASVAQPQGLDNFGARFDSSAMGRFMSPDWANSPEPVPYAKLTNPQSLNLYAFAGNNPESAPDIDGHMISFAQYEASRQSLSGSGSGPLDEAAEDAWDQYMETVLNDQSAAQSPTPQSTPPPPASTAAPATQSGDAAQQQIAISLPEAAPDLSIFDSQRPTVVLAPQDTFVDGSRALPASSPGGQLLMCTTACVGHPLTVTSTDEPTPAHPGDNPHMRQEAVDIRTGSEQETNRVLHCASNCGATWAQNEYRKPSARATGGHVHIEESHPKRTRGDLPPAQ